MPRALPLVASLPSSQVCYTGDTRPCGEVERAINFSGGVDLLVHEATFMSDMSSDAVVKKHSTDVEAGEVFRRSRAKAVVMTHFSQRYGFSVGAVDGGWLGLDERIRERVDIMMDTIMCCRGPLESSSSPPPPSSLSRKGGKDADEDENEIDIN